MRISRGPFIWAFFAVLMTSIGFFAQAAPKTKAVDASTTSPAPKAAKAPRASKTVSTESATSAPISAKSAKAAQAEKAQVKASAAATDSEMVYVTPSGKKYHKADCSMLHVNGAPMKKSEAEAKGLTPCSKCNP